MKKSYIFISPSDPIGCVILEWDYVPTVFEGKRNNGNIKWAWRCGSEDTQRRRAAGCWLLLRAELKQTRRPDDECMESGSLWTETEDNYWGKGVIFSLKLVEEQDTNIHCIKQYCLNVPYFTFGKLNFPNLFVNICWNSKYYLRVLPPLCNVTQAR